MSTLQGLPVSPGLAVGRAVIVRFGGMPAFRRAIEPDEIESEERRLRRAARQASEEFLAHSREAIGEMGAELAAILEAHGLIAADETFLSAIVESMRRDRVNVEWALASVTREFGERLEKADSAAMRERATDIADVAREIAGHLSGFGRTLSVELGRFGAGAGPLAKMLGAALAAAAVGYGAKLALAAFYKQDPAIARKRR